jgi:hypothetical protein
MGSDIPALSRKRGNGAFTSAVVPGLAGDRESHRPDHLGTAREERAFLTTRPASLSLR